MRRARSGSSGCAGCAVPAVAVGMPWLGAGTLDSPMRTPFPCGSNCGRAEVLDVMVAVAGGIAAGGGTERLEDLGDRATCGRSRVVEELGPCGRIDRGWGCDGGLCRLCRPVVAVGMPWLGAGTLDSPMRTPLPCGSNCGRAEVLDVMVAVAGGIAAGGGTGGSRTSGIAPRAGARGSSTRRRAVHLRLPDHEDERRRQARLPASDARVLAPYGLSSERGRSSAGLPPAPASVDERRADGPLLPLLTLGSSGGGHGDRSRARATRDRSAPRCRRRSVPSVRAGRSHAVGGAADSVAPHARMWRGAPARRRRASRQRSMWSSSVCAARASACRRGTRILLAASARALGWLARRRAAARVAAPGRVGRAGATARGGRRCAAATHLARDGRRRP